jgi:hypothetical protein
MLSYYSAMHWLGGSAMGRSSAWRGNCRWKKIPNLLGVILFLLIDSYAGLVRRALRVWIAWCKTAFCTSIAR